MRTVNIPSISKRPVKVFEQKDIVEMQRSREKLADEILSLNTTIEAKESPEWARIVTDSHDRLCEIERKRMFIPVQDTHQHAEIVGQWNERFRLTQELMDAKKRRYEKQSLLRQLSQRIESLVSNLKKQQGEADA